MNERGTMDGTTSLSQGRRGLFAMLASVLLASVVVIAPVAAPTASAAGGVLQLTKNIDGVSAVTGLPGQEFTYVVGFTCSAQNQTDTCDGYVISDVLPTFTDVFGGTSQMVPDVGSVVYPPGVWAPGGEPHFEGTAPNVKLVGTLGGLVGGYTGSISFVAAAPAGLFAPGATVLSNTATGPAGVSSPTVTATITPPPLSPWTIAKTGPASLRLGQDGTYTITACPTTPGSPLPSPFVISDTLPAGATYVSSSPAGVLSGVNPSTGASTVGWTFTGAQIFGVLVNGCVQVQVTVRYNADPPNPAPPAEPLAPVNPLGAVKTNTATGTYGGVSLGNASVNTTLRGAIPSIDASKSVGVGTYYVLKGDTVRYDLAFTNTSEPGSPDLTDVVLTDGPVPAGISITSIDPGTWPGAVTATIEWGDTNVFGSSTTVSSGAAAISVPTTTKWFRWTFTGDMPATWATAGLHLNGTATGDPTQVVTNCLTATANGGTLTDSNLGNNCADIRIETAQPDPSVAKSIVEARGRGLDGLFDTPDDVFHSANKVEPGDRIKYQILVSNGADATGPLTDPVVRDCASNTVYLQDPLNVAPGTGWTSVPYDGPVCLPGSTGLKFTFTGSIAPNASSTVATYTVLTNKYGDLPSITPFGDYSNTATLTKGTSGTYEHCNCSSTVTFTVPAFIFLNSEKRVIGARDPGYASPTAVQWLKSGETLPGGGVKWKVSILNQGNVPAVNPVFIDIWPHVGDTGVKLTGIPQLSEFDPYLVNPIVLPVDLDGNGVNRWSVQYSKSYNPCRNELGNPATLTPGTFPAGCEAPNWTSNASLLELPTYHSIRVFYNGTIPVAAAATNPLEFSWEMRVPLTAPSYDTPATTPTTTSPWDRLGGCLADDDNIPKSQGPSVPPSATICPRAINTFAWSAEATGIPAKFNPGRLSAQPPLVQVQVTAPPRLNALGDRVFFDTNYNGIQDAGELGVSGVYVELYTLDGQNPVLFGFTYTDANGNYLFDNLPNGNYKVRFYPPPSYYISPQDRDGLGSVDLGTPGNGNTDSDIPQVPSGTGSGIPDPSTAIPYYDTTSVNLTSGQASEFDPTWDAGIWRPLPAINIDKVTKDSAWADGQAGDGVEIPFKRPVTWIYTITNTGNTRLENVKVGDDNGTPLVPGDDFTVSNCSIVFGGTNADGLLSSPVAPIALNRGAVMKCTATGIAGNVLYNNIATVEGTPVLDSGAQLKPEDRTPVKDSDPSSYFGVEYDLALGKVATTVQCAPLAPAVTLVSCTNVNQGGEITWTMRVVNQGNKNSRAFTVKDAIPAGLAYVAGSITYTTGGPGGSSVGTPVPSISSNAMTIAFTDVIGLVPNAYVDIQFKTTVTDIKQRPFRNWSEVSSDSSGFYNTTDSDSLPDSDTGSDNGPGLGTPPNDNVIDITNLTNMPDFQTGDEDDNDFADVGGKVLYDLALVKTVSPTPLIGADGLATWTLTIKNQGDVASGPYSVTDNVPGGLQVLSSSPAATSSAGRTLTWNMPNLVPGATATITINTKVTDQSKKPFVNWAEISGDSASTYSIAGDTVTDIDSTPDAFLGDDPNAGTGTGPTNSGGAPEPNIDRTSNTDVNTDIVGDEDDSDQAVLGSDILYDLALVKTVDAPTVAPTGTITWTITVKNQGNVASKAYTVTDTIPTGLTVAAGTTPSSSNVGQVYKWIMPSLDPGLTATITITTTISDINKRPFRNWAEVSADSAADYGTVDVDSSPDTTTGADTGAGTNFGDPPNDLWVDRVLDAGNMFPADLGAGTDQDDNDLAEVDVPVTYDLALRKTVSPATVAQNGTVTWTITVFNQGNVDSGPVTVRDTLPGGITFGSAVPDPSGNPLTGVYTWNIANIAPAGTATIVITSSATDLKLRPFRNWAEISNDAAGTYSVPGFPVVKDVDSTPDTNTGSDPGAGTGVDPNDAPYIDDEILKTPGTGDEDDNDLAEVGSNVIYDLALAKIAEATPVAYNQQPTWRIRVYNQGNVTSGALQVKDRLPTGLTFFAGDVFTSGGAALVGASCNSLTVTCSIPNIAAGSYVDIVLTTSITGGNLSTAPWRNWAEISSDSAQQLYGVDDIDSMPDTVTGSDNTLPNDAYLAPGILAPLGATYPPSVGQPNTINDKTVDEDDNDDAVITTSSYYDLALAKTVSANVIQYNDTITYTITVKNQGTVPSGLYSVVDKFPVGLNLVSFSAGGSYDSINRLLTWNNLTSLSPNETRVLTITATIADINQRPFRNSAEISEDAAQEVYGIADIDSIPDANQANDGTYPVLIELPTGPAGIDNASINDAGVGPDAPPITATTGGQDDADIADVGVQVVYDLALSKVVDATNLLTNGYETGTATFTLMIKNQGTVPSNDFVITDWVPVGIEPITPIANGGVWNSTDRTITWPVAQLLPTIEITRVYTVTVSDITKQPWRNIAEISADSAVDYLAPAVPNSGKDIDSTPDIDTTNDGTYPPLGSDPGTEIDNLAIGDDLVGDYVDPQDDADIADLGFNVVYDLALAKVVNANTVAYNVGNAAYDPITFTLTVQNQGNVDSKQFVVTDVVPAGLTPVEPIANGGVWASGPRTITWTIGNLNGSPQLNPGESMTLSYTATVTDVTKRPFRNFAEISADGADNYDNLTRNVEDKDSIPDALTGNDGAYPSLTNTPAAPSGIDNFGANAIDQAGVGADAQTGLANAPVDGPQDDADIADVWLPVTYDLALAKTVDAYTVAYNSTITYTIVVKNQGNVPSLAFDVTDTVPAGLAVATAGGGNTGTAGKIIWTIDNLEPGANRTLTWTATIADITKRPFRNYAEISRDSAGSYSTTNLPGGVVAVVTDVDSQPDATTGNDGTYPDLTNTPAAPSGIDNFGVNAIDQAGVGPDAPPISVGPPPSGGQDDADIADVWVPVTYDLALSKVATVDGSTDTASIAYNDVITYTITVKNQGNVPSNDFKIVDTVPAGLTVIDSGGATGVSTLAWTIANLNPGASQTLTFTAKIADFTKRPFRNFAEISEDSAADYSTPGHDQATAITVTDVDSKPDTNQTNDGVYPALVEHPVQGTGIDNLVIGDAGTGADAGTTPPTDGPQDDADIADVGADVVYDLALAKVASASTMAPDGSVVFTITVKNQGTVPSGDFVITDTLPAGMAASVASDGGNTAVAGKVTWTVVNLNPGQSATRTVTVVVTDITKRPFKNIAEISADSADDYDVPGRPDVVGTPIDIEDIDSVPDTTTTNDNGDSGTGPDGYGTYENPTNDVTTIGPAEGPGTGGQDDADVAFVDVPVLYDLALVKTGPETIDPYGEAVFTIQVKNQGNVPSGNYTVLDTIPTGLQATAASDGGVIAGQTVTFALSGLAPGATKTLTVTVRITDINTRPWVNYAEVSLDGADGYDTIGYENPARGDVEDADSVPNTDIADDKLVDQTELPADQFNDPKVDEDDHDIAPITVIVDYDLALVKILPGGQSFQLGSNITFTIQVKNQGNVNSGPFSVQDVIPAGLTFVTASDNPLNAGQVVSWDLASLAPGEIKTITMTVRIVDITLSSYVNFSEIVTDGADAYDKPGSNVEDDDSTPDADITNDPLVDTDDVNIDTIPGDEDDHDRALLDPLKVDSDNPVPPVDPLPETGSNTFQLLYAGFGLLAAGLLAVTITRRRRRQVA